MQRIKPRGGWILLETITAVVLIGMMALLLVLVLRQRDRGYKALSDARAAARAAEAALTAMQSGATRPLPDSAEAKITITETSQAAEVPGMEWVSVEATVGGHSAEITGLVPRQVVAMGLGGTP
jgi:type II secretory pathway pseudopilin PulG